MKTVVRMRFGSHLYGTSTPESDLDFKSVFLPDAKARFGVWPEGVQA
jgi:predicted nucleotidyltransferase